MQDRKDRRGQNVEHGVLSAHGAAQSNTEGHRAVQCSAVRGVEGHPVLGCVHGACVLHCARGTIAFSKHCVYHVKLGVPCAADTQSCPHQHNGIQSRVGAKQYPAVQSKAEQGEENSNNITPRASPMHLTPLWTHQDIPKGGGQSVLCSSLQHLGLCYTDVLPNGFQA